MQYYKDVVQDRNGNVIGAAVVTITDYPGGAASTVYATDAVGANINPITCNADGEFSFYAKAGRYNFSIAKSGITTDTASNVPVGATQNDAISPAWASYSTINNGFRFVINDYPIASQFGLNAVGIAEALVGAIDIPSTSAAANHASGVSGYARSASTTQGGVGVFGFGGVTASGCPAWAMNTVASNTSAPQGATETGYNNVTLYGLEMDFNVYKLSGGGTPNVAMRGIYMIGASEVQSSSAVVYAIDIDQHGYLANIPWKRGLSFSGAYGVSATDGFYTEDGATTRAINVGATGTGNNVSSQPITFRSRSTGAVDYSGTLQADGDGNVILNSGNPSALFAFTQNGTTYSQIVNGQPQFCKQSAIPAGGSSTVGVTLTSTATLGLFFGSGAPTMSAAKGSLYMRTDGSSTSTRAYVNTDGATAWTNLTSAT